MASISLLFRTNEGLPADRLVFDTDTMLNEDIGARQGLAFRLEVSTVEGGGPWRSSRCLEKGGILA